MQTYSNKYTFISTLLIVLSVIGYPLITTLLLPLLGAGQEDSAISRLVTVPYRLFVLCIAIYLIFQSQRYNLQRPNKPFEFKIFVLFWILYLIRIIFDIYLRENVVSGSFSDTVKFFVPFITLPVIIATYYSSNSIDFSKAHKYLVYLGLFFLIILLFQSPEMIGESEDLETRKGANVALGSIGLGQKCVAICIIILSYIRHYNVSKIVRFLCLGGVLLSFFLMLRAGSRGPLFQGISLFAFYLAFKNYNLLKTVFVLVFILTSLYLFRDYIVDFIYDVSPVLGNRLQSSFIDGDTSGRDVYYKLALDNFYKSPIFGETFLVDGRIYAHNYFIDTLMALGLVGGFLFLIIVYNMFRRVISLIRYDSKFDWIALLCLQCFLGGLTSGCFYTDTEFSKYLILLFTCHTIIVYNNRVESKKISSVK